MRGGGRGGATRRPALAASLVLAAQALAALPWAGGAQDGRPEHLFYYVDRQDAWESFRANVDRIDVVAPGWFSVDDRGLVWGDVDRRVLDLAREHGVGVMPLVVNPGFDQEMLHRLLSDDEARARAVASFVELCRRHGLAGIQFDFENLSVRDRDAYTRFYRETAEALHAEGFRISVAVVHRPDELPGPTRYHAWLHDSWRGGYDLRALAEAGDFVSVMTYSQHTRRTPPGPQAGIPWVEEVVAYFLRFMPPEKLSLGIPTGSQHWYTSWEAHITPELARSYSRQLSHAEALGLLERNGTEPRWMDDQEVPYGWFGRGGTFEWVFLEDARSFRAKLGVVERHGLRGFSVWVLGPEDPRVWEVLGER